MRYIIAMTAGGTMVAAAFAAGFFIGIGVCLGFECGEKI